MTTHTSHTDFARDFLGLETDAPAVFVPASLRPAGPRAVTDADLAAFVAVAQGVCDAHKANHDNHPAYGCKLTIAKGRRYAKLVTRPELGAGCSVYCFVDLTNGNILKAASWKAPAKHARGNIFSANPASALTSYGAAYLR